MNTSDLDICKKGIHLLQTDKLTLYSQKKIVDQLNQIGCNYGTATLNKIVKFKSQPGKRVNVGKKTLFLIAEGLKQVIKTDLSMVLEEATGKFLFQQGAAKQNVLPPIKAKAIIEGNNGFTYHAEGRRSPEEKIKFMEGAEAGNIITELGIRLNSFSNYFFTTRESAYKDKIRQLLKDGIHLHCYFLNPKGRFAQSYFKDREQAKKDNLEIRAYEAMPEIIDKLIFTRDELNKEGYKGKVKIFKYDSTPQFHGLVIGNKRMYVSHYIYGVKRSDAPVIEIHKKNNLRLFLKYLNSINALKERAIELP